VSPEAHKALSLLSGMKPGAVGIRATYVPVGLEMRFHFDFLFDRDKKHQFDEAIPLDGASLGGWGLGGRV
jgi:hypothetical protein